MILEKIKHTLWGDLTREELAKFGMLTLIFACTIGTYWLMRPLKDSLFYKMVGKLYQPHAKIAACLILIPLVLIYSKLVDLYEKQKLFYIIAGFYTVLFVIIYLFLLHPTIGIANSVPDKGRWLGWLIYLGVESFGSLMIQLFWSFVVSSTDTNTAKRGYPLITAGGQLGAISGPVIATQAGYLGMPMLVLFIIAGIAMIPFLVKMFIKKYPSSAENHVIADSAHQTGMIEGVRLLFTRPYLLAILGVGSFLAIVDVILEYQMMFIADDVYRTPEALARFGGFFGIATNSCAFLFALIGTSYFMRRFGLTFCLVVFPMLMMLVVGKIFFFPTLWVVFSAMVIMRVLSYALNNPCKDIMYIPTSKDVKFKAKGWIDMFGHRNAKAAGSGINTFFTTLPDLLFFGSLISMGVLGLWVIVAFYLGQSNKKLIASGKVIS